MKKKFALLLAGMSMISGVALADTLNYGMQFKMNDEAPYTIRGNVKNEWKIAKGSYKTDSGLEFKFDVDRDFKTFNESGFEDHEGWDMNFALYYPMPSFELAGLTFNNKIGAEFYYDQEDSGYYDYASTNLRGYDSGWTEKEIGVAWSTNTKLDPNTFLGAKFWARNVDYKYESKGADESKMVYGIQTSLIKPFNKNWTFVSFLDAYWGGYSDGGNTFTRGDWGNPDGFNYEFLSILDYHRDIYKAGNFRLYYKTEFGALWFGQGEEYKDTSINVKRIFVAPAVGVDYKVGENISLYADTSYKVLGFASKGNGDENDWDEWEATAGFKVKI